jgi:hypothetical protein
MLVCVLHLFIFFSAAAAAIDLKITHGLDDMIFFIAFPMTEYTIYVIK